jgi:hypothetical protein
MGDHYLLLKWGGMKQWDFRDSSPAMQAALEEYFDIGVPFAAIKTHLTDRQKELLCTVVDEMDGTIQSDWTGEFMTKDEAKTYIMEGT